MRSTLIGKVSFGALCVAAWAAAAAMVTSAQRASAEVSAQAVGLTSAPDLSGRWQGRPQEVSARRGCTGDACMLTLDVSRCGTGWCGVEVLPGPAAGKSESCGGTAMKLDGGSVPGEAEQPTIFKGTLELAKGTEPYTIEAYMRATSDRDPEARLEIIGDTGGEFRYFRRTFPFSVALARAGDAHCLPEKSVSSLELGSLERGFGRR